MNSLFKYVLPLLFAISLAACDSSAPNFEGTYGRVIDGKMTPIVRVDKKDGGWLITEYLRDEPGVLATKYARTATLYSHEHLPQFTPPEEWPKDLYVLQVNGSIDSLVQMPKDGEIKRGPYSKLVAKSGYSYQNYSVAAGSGRSKDNKVYFGGEVTKLD